MWKTLYQSVQGTSHQRSGQVCQDSSTARQLVLDDETVLLLACSDGAGSADYSQFGSALACQTFLDLMAGELRGSGRLYAVDHERASDWVRQVHQALLAEAARRGVDARQLACTLLFAAVGESGAAFGQIGDGAIVVWRDGQYQNLFWPQSGEYINTTNFVTDPRWPSNFEFAWHEQPIDEVALLTDGLQMVGMNFAQRQAHGPFFAPLFQSLRRQADAAELVGPMRAFLESPQLAERTDDDKTLVLATRLAG